jgi:hypothetical protein
MNIIAAIILPLDDDHLAEKLGRQKDALALRKADRVRLWRGYTPSTLYWVYDGSTAEWGEFQRRLMEAIVKDGFDLTWTALCGPDYVGFNYVPQGSVWGCKEIIVSDVGRSADFTHGAITSLSTLRSCNVWEKVLPDIMSLCKDAERGANWVVSGFSMVCPKSARIMLNEGKSNKEVYRAPMVTIWP